MKKTVDEKSTYHVVFWDPQLVYEREVLIMARNVGQARQIIAREYGGLYPEVTRIKVDR
jgi:hypothetical protein